MYSLKICILSFLDMNSFEIYILTLLDMNSLYLLFITFRHEFIRKFLYFIIFDMDSLKIVFYDI